MISAAQVFGMNEQNFDPKELKRRFRRKARLFHPDMNGSPNARREWEDLCKAFTLLNHQELREALAGRKIFSETLLYSQVELSSRAALLFENLKVSKKKEA